MGDNLMGQSISQLRRWSRGQLVDHRQLNEPVDVLNDMTRGVGVPRQVMAAAVIPPVTPRPFLRVPVFAVIGHYFPSDTPPYWCYALDTDTNDPHSWNGDMWFTKPSTSPGPHIKAYPWPGSPASDYTVTFTGGSPQRIRVYPSSMYVVYSYEVLTPTTRQALLIPFVRRFSRL